VRKPSTLIVFAVLLALGVELLRRQVAREAVAAPAGGLASAVTSRVRAPRTAPSGADELERLSKLHAAGELSDDEYAAAKAKALGSS
jgi:hypothetical protein